MFKYSDTNKRYHSLDYANRQRYGCKVAKLCLDVGYTCINRDGIKGNEGCHFCPGKAVSGFTIQEPPIEQIARQKALIALKWPTAKYQLYWQSFSNTYAPFETNKANYDLFRKIPDVVALAIATRCDSLNDKTLAYLDSLNKEIDVTIEVGLQSKYDQTRKLLNCRYDLEDFARCVNRISATSCSLVVHVINGLPGETPAMMIETIKYLNTLPIQGLKIHMLHLDRSTRLSQDFIRQPFTLLTQDEYTDIVIEQLTYLRPEIVIHRLTGDGIREQLVAPLWTINKTSVLNMIDKKMKSRGICQGDNA